MRLAEYQEIAGKLKKRYAILLGEYENWKGSAASNYDNSVQMDRCMAAMEENLRAREIVIETFERNANEKIQT